MQITQVNSVLTCKFCLLSHVAGMVPRADTYLPPHRGPPQMCHDLCLARAVSAMGSVPWQCMPWAASPATAAVLLRDPGVTKQ